MLKNEKMKNPQKAMWLSIIPGLGQLYNTQKVKGFILLLVFLGELLEAFFVGIRLLLACTALVVYQWRIIPYSY